VARFEIGFSWRLRFDPTTYDRYCGIDQRLHKECLRCSLHLIGFYTDKDKTFKLDLDFLLKVFWKVYHQLNNLHFVKLLYSPLNPLYFKVALHFRVQFSLLTRCILLGY